MEECYKYKNLKAVRFKISVGCGTFVQITLHPEMRARKRSGFNINFLRFKFYLLKSIKIVILLNHGYLSNHIRHSERRITTNRTLEANSNREQGFLTIGLMLCLESCQLTIRITNVANHCILYCIVFICHFTFW